MAAGLHRAQGAAQVQGALTLWTLQSVAQPRLTRNQP